MIYVKYRKALHKLYGKAIGKFSQIKKFFNENAGPRLRIPGLKKRDPGSQLVLVQDT